MYLWLFFRELVSDRVSLISLRKLAVTQGICGSSGALREGMGGNHNTMERLKKKTLTPLSAYYHLQQTVFMANTPDNTSLFRNVVSLLLRPCLSPPPMIAITSVCLYMHTYCSERELRNLPYPDKSNWVAHALGEKWLIIPHLEHESDHTTKVILASLFLTQFAAYSRTHHKQTLDICISK